MDKGKRPMTDAHEEAEGRDKRSSSSSTNGPYFKPVSQEQPTLSIEDLLFRPPCCFLSLNRKMSLTLLGTKCGAAIGCISEADSIAFADMIQVKRVKPPITYLGLPLIDARLGIPECSPLIEKVSTRIVDWKNRALSHAGRLELVNTVLNAFHIYWAKTFMLPTTTLKTVQAMGLRFLWSGPAMKRCIHHGKAELVTLLKSQGGLGIKDLITWNKAACFGLVFRVITRQKSLWVQWIWEHNLRGKQFWTMKIPQDSSWVWRHLLQAREEIRKYICYSISNGLKTSLWHDLWCDKSPLIQNQHARLEWSDVYSNNATVSELIVDKKWSEAVNEISCEELKKSIQQVEINSSLSEDRIIWTPAPNGKFSISSAYHALRPRKTKVKWYQMVWNSLQLPRHSFCLWQALSSTLPTQDNLVKKGVITSSQCLFCQNHRENCKHLFFECPYTKEIWEHIMMVTNLKVDLSDTNKLWWSLIRKCSKKTKYAEVIAVIVGMVVYQIWQERNTRKFQDKQIQASQLKEQIIQSIREYLRIKITEVIHSPELEDILERLQVLVQYKVIEPIQCKWEKPEQGIVRINSDGTVMEGRSGFGGVLRNSQGQPLQMYTGEDPSKSVLMQEINGALQGLIIAKDYTYPKVELHSDSLNMVNMIIGKEEPTWQTLNKITQIRDLLKGFESSSVQHVYRETNAVADYLASLCLGSGVLMFVTPLDEKLSRLVKEDGDGVIYFRGK